jgi:hypothetical protein
MLSFIITVYITIGVVSSFAHLGKWFFGSTIWAIPLIPFIVMHKLIF